MFTTTRAVPVHEATHRCGTPVHVLLRLVSEVERTRAVVQLCLLNATDSLLAPAAESGGVRVHGHTL